MSESNADEPVTTAVLREELSLLLATSMRPEADSDDWDVPAPSEDPTLDLIAIARGDEEEAAAKMCELYAAGNTDAALELATLMRAAAESERERDTLDEDAVAVVVPTMRCAGIDLDSIEKLDSIFVIPDLS